MKIIALAILAAGILAVNARATTVDDPVGDFIPTFSGPHGADLDVVSTTAVISGSNLVLSATMNGAIGTTPGGLYVWGLDRGLGATTANFSAIGLSNIIFDSVVVVLPNGTGQVALLETGTPVATPLGAGAITINGNMFSAVVPLSMLPSTGFATESYTQNLWPRYGGITTDDQISDFAPDASMAGISVPEPASLGLLGLSGLLLVALRGRARAS
jgi:hypothetical protein